MARIRCIDSTIAECSAMARAAGAPPSLVDAASRATLRKFGRPGASKADCARARGYFWAVVRRRSIRGGDAAALRARLVLDAVVADLRRSGRSQTSVVEELERDWSGCVPDEVLREYRLALSA